MQPIIKWRNGESDRSWSLEHITSRPIPVNLAKVMLSSIGFITISVLATIESVVRAILLICQSVLHGLNSKQASVAKDKLNSALFTIGWSVGVQIPNLIYGRIFSHESLVRRNCSRSLGYWIMRKSDREFANHFFNS